MAKFGVDFDCGKVLTIGDFLNAVQYALKHRKKYIYIMPEESNIGSVFHSIQCKFFVYRDDRNSNVWEDGTI